MMNQVVINLKNIYDSKPPLLKILCNEKIVYHDSPTTGDVSITFLSDPERPISITICKEGLDKETIDKKNKQLVIVGDITCNDVIMPKCHNGRFHRKNNVYNANDILQTDELHSNGEWRITFPFRPLVGHFDQQKIYSSYQYNDIDVESVVVRTQDKNFPEFKKNRSFYKTLKDEFQECDIACFGCSQTWGACIKDEDSWPRYLALETGKKVCNFGLAGSNIQEIFACVRSYTDMYHPKQVILLLPAVWRMQIYDEDTGYYMNVHWKNSNIKKFIVLGNEANIALLSKQMLNFLDELKYKRNIKPCFASWVGEEHINFSNQSYLRKYMLPYLEFKNYPVAPDGRHFSAEYNKIYSKLVANNLNLL